jgi:hypothetical protein
VLCQLSYTHRAQFFKCDFVPRRRARIPLVARQKGLEPLTRGLEGRCSVHLSYWRDRGEPI